MAYDRKVDARVRGVYTEISMWKYAGLLVGPLYQNETFGFYSKGYKTAGEMF